MTAIDPLAVDLVAVRLMGFDEQSLPKLRGPMEDPGPRITAVRSAGDVLVAERSGPDEEIVECELDDITASRPFEAHAGWIGHVEFEEARRA